MLIAWHDDDDDDDDYIALFKYLLSQGIIFDNVLGAFVFKIYCKTSEMSS